MDSDAEEEDAGSVSAGAEIGNSENADQGPTNALQNTLFP
jgi:hypothetical protein